MHYTERIRDLREDHDLTQTDIANLLHIGQRTYADYELGKTRIPLDSIIIFAKHYNVSKDYVCGCNNEKKKFPTE
ncbi:MAG: helix-turn-helix domain-containing protein [Clostridiales bacterium]|nr:helix-turn-helix domain-containing protein [Clostridiales bacterium]